LSALRVPACAACGRAIWPPRLACPRCGAAEWDALDASTGTVLEVTDAPGASGETVRLGTIALALPVAAQPVEGGGGQDGIPVVARCEGCEPGDRVGLELVDGVLTARPQGPPKQST
jgi:Rubredoxin-like zinc ribbon domain (DUF35_N)